MQGPHLLAPTGSDLQRYGQEGVVFAGYHDDLNFLTIHGRSRFPGLNIWLRNGRKMEVKVPLGCLLIQAGKQIEWLTGGECRAGMHEVVVTNHTIEAFNRASEQNRSLWRVSSTESNANYISPISVICTHIVRCCAEASWPLCHVTSCQQRPSPLCWRICQARACCY